MLTTEQKIRVRASNRMPLGRSPLAGYEWTVSARPGYSQVLILARVESPERPNVTRLEVVGACHDQLAAERIVWLHNHDLCLPETSEEADAMGIRR